MAKTYWFKVNPAGDVYEFNSEGLQGTIHKMVRFEEIAPGVYNAALGDVRENGEIDFEINTNNGDYYTVIYTVADIIKHFSKVYPAAKIHITGTDDRRNAAYQRRLTVALQSSAVNFAFWGLKEDGGDWEPFSKSENYAAFLLVPVE
jgi:hypothetical protein